MPVKCTWLGKGCCLHMRIEGRWTIAEWLSAAETAGRMAFQAPEPIAMIIEYATPEAYVPEMLFQLIPRAASSTIVVSPQVREIIVANKPGVIRLTSETFTRMYGITKVRYVDTYEEALVALGMGTAGV